MQISGLSKIKIGIPDPGKPAESPAPAEETAAEVTPTPPPDPPKPAEDQDKKEEKDERPTYEEMVKAFEDLLLNHPLVYPLRLRMIEQKKGEYLVYQGQYSNVWVWLRYPLCLFEKFSLLRIIKGMPHDSVLYRYFKDQKMV